MATTAHQTTVNETPRHRLGTVGSQDVSDALTTCGRSGTATRLESLMDQRVAGIKVAD